jgi:hypothetical protein
MNKISTIIDISVHFTMILTCILALIFTPFNHWMIYCLIWVGTSLLKTLIIAKLEDKNKR